uniref:Uncharacterized protein n=1 Tax=Globisporangium ultimum (strain ATCC 200006 / CBS 805.95 / DAOM BR144) TaxID=431595 RepID=K3WSB8_GLOUD
MVAQLVQFLLYFRGQIPIPVKKAIKCVNTAERLFAGSLHALFAGRVHSALLIFGPSVVSPREVYVLDFVEHAGDNATIEEQEASPALSKEKTAQKRSTPIPGFVPKQNFRLRLPRTNKQGNRTHHIILSGANNLPSTISSMIGNEHQDTQAGSESDVIKVAEPWFCQKNVALGQDLIWYAFDKPVAGFTGVV